MSHCLSRERAEQLDGAAPRLESMGGVASLVWEGIPALAQLSDDPDLSARVVQFSGATHFSSCENSEMCSKLQ